MNEFTQRYLGNILLAIARSLGIESKVVSFYIMPAGLKLSADNREIPLRKDFVRQIIESTIKGSISPLKGVFWLERITITTRE